MVGVHIDLPQQLHQGVPGSSVDPPKTKAGPKQVQAQAEAMKITTGVLPAAVETNAGEVGPQEETASAAVSNGTLLLPEPVPCMGSSTITGQVDGRCHPWSFSMDQADIGAYPSLQVPDLPLEKHSGELPDVLGDLKGFDDNIHLIFEAGSDRNDGAVSPECGPWCRPERPGHPRERSQTRLASLPVSSTTSLVSLWLESAWTWKVSFGMAERSAGVLLLLLFFS